MANGDCLASQDSSLDLAALKAFNTEDTEKFFENDHRDPFSRIPFILLPHSELCALCVLCGETAFSWVFQCSKACPLCESATRLP
jgi:hypothetical protein